MRKNTDGYVLVYVLIVVVLLSLTALGVCSITLRNLQVQQASVEQMRERYEAEGSVERFVAKLLAFQALTSPSYNSESDARAAARTYFWDAIQDMATDIVTVQESSLTWEDNNSCQFTVQASADGQVLTAVLDVSVSISITSRWISTATEDDSDDGHYEYSYVISGVSFTYQSYDISTSGAAGGEGGRTA